MSTTSARNTFVAIMFGIAVLLALGEYAVPVLISGLGAVLASASWVRL